MNLNPDCILRHSVQHFITLQDPKEKTLKDPETCTVAAPSSLNFSYRFPTFSVTSYQQLLLTAFHLEKVAKQRLLAQLMLQTGD